MATTRIISMHVNQGKTIADCLASRIGYSKNPEKTQGGELISAYQCDPKTADAEFLLSKRHIHNHIIWNSTTLDCKRKFRDFLGSGRAVARLSDDICTEHRLSVIADPKRGKNHYGKWLGDNANPTHRELLCGLIDTALLQKPDSFDTLLKLLAEAGCEVRRRGNTLSLRHPDRKGFNRLSSIEGYTEDEMRELLLHKQNVDRMLGKNEREEEKKKEHHRQ